MNLPSPKICRRIRQLFELCGSSNANEANSARDKLAELLAKHGLQWRDIPTILAATEERRDHPTASQARSQAKWPADAPQVNVLALTLRLIELHIDLTPEQRMAAALWVLHTYVFGRFQITPRLPLLSPVHGCGKTTLLTLLELLCADPYKTDNVTAAAVYHLLATAENTLLFDEGDNLGLLNNPVLRALFNAGHRRGGSITRFIGGRPRKFPLYAPLSVAAIGVLPRPFMHRSVIIDMQRHPVSGPSLKRLDETDPTFPAARVEIQKWAATCVLDPDPEMPPKLHNRVADNWRVLFAIADDLGHGEEARVAAVALSAHRHDEDFGIALLIDIRRVFYSLGVDRISSLDLKAQLVELDDCQWLDWRGPHDEKPPHEITQSEIAYLLRRFNIKPRTIWSANRRPGDKSRRGYLLSQFEAAWATYCPSADTPTQPSRIIRLSRP